MIIWASVFTMVRNGVEQPADAQFKGKEYVSMDNASIEVLPGIWKECQRWEQRCSWCGGEAHAQTCPGDGRMHHHGGIHEPQGMAAMEWWSGLGYLVACDTCYPKAKALWRRARVAQEAENALKGEVR